MFIVCVLVPGLIHMVINEELKLICFLIGILKRSFLSEQSKKKSETVTTTFHPRVSYMDYFIKCSGKGLIQKKKKNTGSFLL